MAVVGRALLAVSVAAVVLMAGGCADMQSALPTRAQWGAIAGPDLNCPDVTAVVRPGSPQYYDITGDGTAEAFVDLICAGADPVTAPDQLEVFKGTSRSSRMMRLTSVAAHQNEQVFLAHGCVYFTGRSVVVIGRMRPDARPGAAPTVLVKNVWTWANGRIGAAPRTALKTTDGLPPGCA
jgi:hypothetical protein